MDPYTRATIPWIGLVPQDKQCSENLEYIYYLARDLGYVFPGMPDVGSIPGQEIDDIARYPPVVPWEDYKEYRTMSFDELVRATPGILEILPDITRDDLFFFRTRNYLGSDRRTSNGGIIPDISNLREILNRLDIYDNLRPTTQQLFDKLYGSRLKFANPPKISFLEDNIIAFDTEMGEPRRVRDIGIRIGVRIPDGQDPDIYLYSWLEKLIDFLNSVHYRPINTNINLPSVEQMMNLDWPGFVKFVQQYTTPEILNKYGQFAYDNRTDLLLNLYTLPEYTLSNNKF